MDQQRAKEILRATHAGQPSGSVAECEAACAQLETNPELREWFESELSSPSDFDCSICAKLNAVAPPTGMAGQIKDSLGGAADAPVSMLRFLLPAMAAAALFVVGFFVFSQKDDDPAGGDVAQVVAERSGRTLDHFRGDMANFALTSLKLQHKGGELPELSSWVAEHGGPMGNLRDAVEGKRGMGCAVVEWGGAKVSLICFLNEDDQVVHLFVTKRCEVDCDGIEELITRDVEAKGLHTAGWADEETVYLLVGADPTVQVGPML